MTSLLFIRHGETDWNVEKRWQGQIDVPLNANGHRQAQQMAEALAHLPISAIYASDLRRATETASYLAAWFKVEVKTDPRLREIHQGEWQGMTIGEIQTKYTFRFHSRKERPLEIAPPGGETVRQVGERVMAFVRELPPSHPETTIAVVTHGFVMALMQVLLKQKPFAQLWDEIPDSGMWREYRVTEDDLKRATARLAKN